MPLLAGTLIAAILIGISIVVFACTRAGRRACQKNAPESLADATAQSGRSDLQGPHHHARTTVAPRIHQSSAAELAARSDAELSEAEERITSRLDELDELIAEEDDDLRQMERFLDKSSRRERRRTRRRPKNRRDGYDRDDDDDDDSFTAA